MKSKLQPLHLSPLKINEYFEKFYEERDKSNSSKKFMTE